MFKKLLVVVAVVFAAYSMNAQVAFEKGDIGVNVGVQLRSFYRSLTPGVTASAEFGLFPIGKAGVISLGGNINASYGSGKVYIDGSYGSGKVYIDPSFRAAFHLGFLNTDKFDVYGGFMSGIRLYYPKNFFVDDFFGGRYMFKGNMGVFAEVGFLSSTNLRGGLCWVL